jgi:hypothetical protein
MSVSAPANQHRTTVRPVPKPIRRPIATGAVARRLAETEGFAFADIAADQEAADALDVATLVDTRRDPLVVEMTRLFTAIRCDLNTPPAVRALATRGEACGREAVRLDRIIAEHDQRARTEVAASIVAGRTVVGALECLLTGKEPGEALLPWPLEPARCGRVRASDQPSVGEGLTTAACDRDSQHEGPCVFVVVPSGATP